MSSALDPRFGMSALKEELAERVTPDCEVPERECQWTNVLDSLADGKDLETALNDVTNNSLLRKITNATGRFISLIDREHALRIANGDAAWPASRFFKRLVDTLPEGDPILHVLTPNYDTLFEHAADAIGIRYTNGFHGGLERRTDWSAADRSMLLGRRVNRRGRLATIHKPRKHVRLYKVHGSLNFFFHRDTVVENNSWMWDAPWFARRVMITPGLSKYQTLQNYRRELLTDADAAIEGASHFLFLGYGFNDAHLEAYIKQKLITQACNGLIVTKESNSRIESLLRKAPNLWLVCNTHGDDMDGTRILNKRYAGWLTIPTKRLWDIGTFTTEILGA